MDQQEILTEKIENVYPDGASSTNFFNVMKIIVIIVIVLIFLFFILRYLAISTKSGKKMNQYVRSSILNFYGEDDKELAEKLALLKKQKAAQLEEAKKKSNLNQVKNSIQSEIESKRPKREQLKHDITTTSCIQKRNKPAYCYIGSDRGYRSCVEIDPNDKCMSKKIFPTREVCINPTLRV